MFSLKIILCLIIFIISIFFDSYNHEYSNKTSYQIFECENIPLTVVKHLKLSNANRLIISHININSIRNKFDELKYKIQGNVDKCVISETKLDIICPSTQFCFDGYSKPFRPDRDKSGGVIYIFIRNDILGNVMKTDNWN